MFFYICGILFTSTTIQVKCPKPEGFKEWLSFYFVLLIWPVALPILIFSDEKDLVWTIKDEK